MSWERDILADTPEGLAARNTATLLALQLQSQVQRFLDTVESHEAEMSGMRSTLSDAERIGLAVMRAAGAGRKMISVTTLITNHTTVRDTPTDGMRT